VTPLILVALAVLFCAGRSPAAPTQGIATVADRSAPRRRDRHDRQVGAAEFRHRRCDDREAQVLLIQSGFDLCKRVADNPEAHRRTPSFREAPRNTRSDQNGLFSPAAPAWRGKAGGDIAPSRRKSRFSRSA